MQDRFKFRYFYNGKIYDVFAVDFTNKAAQLVSLDRKEILLKKGIDTDKLIQCTGLKDKNGKLIYEGDIVNMQHWRTPREIIYINDAYCGWYMKQTKKEKGCTGKDCLSFSSEHIGKAEVIGNIYENPELLEVNND